MTIIEGFFSKRTVSGALARLSSMLLCAKLWGGRNSLSYMQAIRMYIVEI